jgi:multiple sugar transport system substrate-binding protein
MLKRAKSALKGGAPPDFLFSTIVDFSIGRWAYDDQLVDLEGVLGPVRDLFDADTIEVSTLVNGGTGRRGLYALPMGRRSNHLHVWKSLVRAGLVHALRDYTAIWCKGCTPPESVNWTNIDNNRAFLAQTVVMTANGSLSIPAALKRERPDDYYDNAVTIDWPNAANGEPLVIEGYLYRAVVFKGGSNPALAGDFIRFLAEEGWLAHWLTFMGDMFQPPMRKLVEQPFWLDPSDPHRMRAAMQILDRPHLMNMDVRDKQWQSSELFEENVWAKAVHRVVTQGLSPEQAVDEAIARIKQILSE